MLANGFVLDDRGVILGDANGLNDADRLLAIARRIFPRDAFIFREAARVAERQGQPARAAALRDSVRIAHSFHFRADDHVDRDA